MANDIMAKCLSLCFVYRNFRLTKTTDEYYYDGVDPLGGSCISHLPAGPEGAIAWRVVGSALCLRIVDFFFQIQEHTANIRDHLARTRAL